MFEIKKTDSFSNARLGTIRTAHGDIQTPAFMPVGTRGTVKTVTPDHLISMDTQVILGNTYHLMLRPGKEIISKAGGLHQFSNWSRALLTDSGGFQVFSLSKLNQITDEGVYFQSHIDGSTHFLGPLESMEIQKILGSDIVMAFDECPPYPCNREAMERSLKRTHRWAKVCRDYSLQGHQHLFGIVQGGTDAEMRQESAKAITKLNFDGYAIGGLSVGEPNDLMYQVVEATTPLLPIDKPRYLMGVGTPRDIIESVIRGVDMFDCVLPTRNARNGQAFTWNGKISIKSAKYREDFTPLDSNLDCYTTNFSKAYIRHLINVNEVLGMTLVTIQNIAFYLDFMKEIRQSIQNNTLKELYMRILAIYPK